MISEQISKNTAKDQSDDRQPHIWFGLSLDDINRFLKCNSIRKQEIIIVKGANKEVLSFQTRAPKLCFEDNNFKLLIPVVKGHFINSRGTKTEFSKRCICAFYKSHEVEIYIDGETMYVKGQYITSTYSNCDINITDPVFLDLLKSVPMEITRIEKPFGLKAFPDGRVIRIIPMINKNNIVNFKLFYTNPNVLLDYTTFIDSPVDVVNMRNSSILYQYIRDSVIEKLREFSLSKKDESNIVVDDCQGVETLGSLNLQYNERRTVFEKFYVKLSSEDRAIETYMKGIIESEEGFIIDIELRTSVYLEAEYLDKQTYSTLGLNRRENSKVWAKSKAPWIHDDLEALGKAYCEKLETKLETMMFKWYYPYLLGLTDIQLYNSDGTISAKYSLNLKSFI